MGFEMQSFFHPPLEEISMSITGPERRPLCYTRTLEADFYARLPAHSAHSSAYLVANQTN